MPDAPTYTFLADLLKEVTVPANGILSRTVFADDRVKAIIFGFDTGQELSEHTASMPAIIHILSGEAEIGLGGDTFRAKPGSWAHMPANTPHSVLARTPTVMLLLMLPDAAANAQAAG